MLSSATDRQASSAQAQYFSYGDAANPIRSGLTLGVPYRSFSPAFFAEGGNAVMSLDLSEELQCSGPATGPSLCANFIRLNDGELRTSAVATSQLFFIADGDGESEACGEHFRWSSGGREGGNMQGSAIGRRSSSQQPCREEMTEIFRTDDALHTKRGSSDL